MAKNTYGTGSFVVMNTGEQAKRSDAGLLNDHRLAARRQPVIYALEGRSSSPGRRCSGCATG